MGHTENFADNLAKQLAGRGMASLTVGGVKADVRVIGKSFIWTVAPADADVFSTGLASGCESSAEDAVNRAAAALTRAISRARLP